MEREQLHVPANMFPVISNVNGADTAMSRGQRYCFKVDKSFTREWKEVTLRRPWHRLEANALRGSFPGTAMPPKG